jgi:hypothetical protein
MKRRRKLRRYGLLSIRAARFASSNARFTRPTRDRADNSTAAVIRTIDEIRRTRPFAKGSHGR